MSSNEQDIENIVERNTTKRIKSGKKGKRVELELVKALNSRFEVLLKNNPDWGQFSRSIGSGNRWGQNVVLSRAAKDTYTGDVTCPMNFRFVLESKGGYNDVDLYAALEGSNSTLDSFLKQVEDDSERSNRMPMLIWKKDRKPRLAFLKTKDLPSKSSNAFPCRFIYNEWSGVLFDDLMKQSDEVFFNI